MPSTQVCMFCRYRRTLGQAEGSQAACTHDNFACAKTKTAAGETRMPLGPSLEQGRPAGRDAQPRR